MSGIKVSFRKIKKLFLCKLVYTIQIRNPFFVSLKRQVLCHHSMPQYLSKWIHCIGLRLGHSVDCNIVDKPYFTASWLMILRFWPSGDIRKWFYLRFNCVGYIFSKCFIDCLLQIILTAKLGWVLSGPNLSWRFCCVDTEVLAEQVRKYKEVFIEACQQVSPDGSIFRHRYMFACQAVRPAGVWQKN